MQHTAGTARLQRISGRASEILPLFVTPAIAAKQLSVSRWLVYELVKSGQIRAVSYNGHNILIPREELERFASEGARQSPEDR